MALTKVSRGLLSGQSTKNLIINGDMQISQRGDYTSAIAAPSAYVLDRWLIDRNRTATVQHTTGHNISGTPAICKAIKLVQTVTGNNYLGARQKIENPEQYIGRTVTYSAWVRSNTSKARIEFYIPGATTHTYVGPNHSGGGEWEYLSFTDTIRSSGASTTAWFVDVMIDSGAYGNTTIAAGDYIEATMLQMELGNVATPFEHRSYGEELALCQRYYYKIGGTSDNRLSTQGTKWSTTHFISIQHPVTMRAAPTFSLKDAGVLQLFNAGSAPISTLVTAPMLSKNFAEIEASTSLAGASAFVRLTDADDWIAFSAEI